MGAATAALVCEKLDVNGDQNVSKAEYVLLFVSKAEYVLLFEEELKPRATLNPKPHTRSFSSRKGRVHKNCRNNIWLSYVLNPSCLNHTGSSS